MWIERCPFPGPDGRACGGHVEVSVGDPDSEDPYYASCECCWATGRDSPTEAAAAASWNAVARRLDADAVLAALRSMLNGLRRDGEGSVMLAGVGRAMDKVRAMAKGSEG
uniref:Uncharacterized protein n=1 Tax=viral metagenome TaxID=1070528 RepID=A0A6H1Z962_9ZZZZ